ncbi:H+-or Na+-translocating f-type, v-type and A-type ATPase superfamily [Corchorus olitorius]|uniref:H+-or Na+-translocating f-type, v-type and A-type ATPase superfamily n=1 Tax=Corchorus olitorius TaxID=93759 RepID=A0A1R3FVL5_9ROSI|nr:H+-or Na+-translocating f-type, v-type and A-type ATPase superfamily [Corchorus olitorius]
MKTTATRSAPTDVPSLDLASTLVDSAAGAFKKLNPSQNLETFDLSSSPSTRLGPEVCGLVCVCGRGKLGAGGCEREREDESVVVVRENGGRRIV